MMSDPRGKKVETIDSKKKLTKIKDLEPGTENLCIVGEVRPG